MDLARIVQKLRRAGRPTFLSRFAYVSAGVPILVLVYIAARGWSPDRALETLLQGLVPLIAVVIGVRLERGAADRAERERAKRDERREHEAEARRDAEIRTQVAIGVSSVCDYLRPIRDKIVRQTAVPPHEINELTRRVRLFEALAPRVLQLRDPIFRSQVYLWFMQAQEVPEDLEILAGSRSNYRDTPAPEPLDENLAKARAAMLEVLKAEGREPKTPTLGDIALGRIARVLAESGSLGVTIDIYDTDPKSEEGELVPVLRGPPTRMFNSTAETASEQPSSPPPTPSRARAILSKPGWYALLATLVMFLYNSKLTEELRAFQHRPILTVRSATLHSVGFALNEGPIQTTADSGLLFDGRVRVVTKLVLVNNSDIEARVRMTTCSDTMAGSARLRSALLNKKARDQMFEITPAKDFFGAPNLLPGDSVTLSFSREIAFAQDTVMTMHYLILYENPIGDLYDTYFWTQYRTGKVPLIPGPTRVVKTAQGRTVQLVPIMVSRKDVMDHLLEVVGSHEDHHIYTKPEGKGLVAWMERAAKRPASSAP